MRHKGAKRFSQPCKNKQTNSTYHPPCLVSVNPNLASLSTETLMPMMPSPWGETTCPRITDTRLHRVSHQSPQTTAMHAVASDIVHTIFCFIGTEVCSFYCSCCWVKIVWWKCIINLLLCIVKLINLNLKLYSLFYSSKTDSCIKF